MPIYEFRNKDTGEIYEKSMYMSDKQKYLETNTNLEQIHTKGMNTISGTNFKVPSGFKDVLNKIHNETPGSQLNL